MTDLPAPPVPPDADLTDFKFMPLEVERLRRSRAWLICKRRPELAFFMLNLWTAAWHSRPAGSLEDDDDVLADAAMCSPERWPDIRADVMRGWFKASDGRLYHPIVAEKVLDSWHGKAVARWKKGVRADPERERTAREEEPSSARHSAGTDAVVLHRSCGRTEGVRGKSAGQADTFRRTSAGRTNGVQRTFAGNADLVRRTSAGRSGAVKRTSSGRTADRPWTSGGHPTDGTRISAGKRS